MIRKSLLETLNPFLVIFMAMFAVNGFFISMLTPIQIEVWVGIFFANLVVCGWLFWRLKPDFSAGSEPETAWTLRQYALVLLPLVVVALPPLLITLSHSHFQVSHHGDLHSGYVHQILVNTSPPVNPFLPDYPANYYWLYHALLATLIRLTGLPNPLLSSLLSFGTLLLIFGWMVQILRLIGFRNKPPLVLGMSAVFIIFCLNLLGFFHAAGHIFAGESVRQPDFILMGDRRLYTLAAKFANYNSFPLGILYFTSGIYAALRLVRGPLRASSMILFIASVIGGFAFQLLTGVFILATLVPAMVVAAGAQVLWSVSPFRMQAVVMAGRDAVLKLWRQLSPGYWIMLVVVSAVTAVFMLWYYKAATQSAGVTGGLSLTNQHNWESLFGAVYPLLPLFLVALIYAWRSRNRFVLLSGLGALIGGVMALVVDMRGNNQYKLVHLTMFFIGLTIIPMLFWLVVQSRSIWRRLGWVFMVAVFGLVLLNLSYFNASMLGTALEIHGGRLYTEKITYEGYHLSSGVEKYQMAFNWLREHTPPSTVVVMPIPDSRRLPMLGERLPYVGIVQFNFVTGIAEYDERVAAVETLLSPDASAQEREAAATYIRAFDSDRPIIALIPHDSTVPASEWDALGMTLLHSSENGDLYLLRECSNCGAQLAG